MTEGTASAGPAAVFADGSRGALAWALVPAAVGFGTLAVCVATIGRRSLSTDEAVALAQAHQPLRDVLHAAVHDDPGQGVYLVLLKLATRAGTDEGTIRIPSAVAIALAAALLVVLGTRLLGRFGGVVAGVALGANAGVVEVAREARPYALGILGIVAATLAFVSALQRGGTWRWLCFAVLAIALPLTHPLAASALLAFAAALAACPGCRERVRNPTTLVVAGLVGAAACALLAWMAADRLDAPEGSGTLDLASLARGALHAFGWSPLLLAATGAGLFALFGGRTLAAAQWQQVVVVGLVVAPAVACLLAETVMPVFTVSSLTLCAPGIALAVAASVDLLPSRETLLVSLTLVAVLAAGILGVRATSAPAQDWRALARAVQRVQGPHETVVVLPPRSRAVLAYYAPYLTTSVRARGDGAWVAVVADTPADAIAQARVAVRTPTYALLRQSRYGDGLRLQHWVRP